MTDDNAEQKTYALFSSPANRRQIAELEASGANVLQIAPLKIIETNAKENCATVNNLSEFDWVIFPDVLAVDCFLKILEASGIDFFELDRLSVLACGEAVGDRLRFAQLHADLIPKSTDAETAFSTLAGYLQKGEFNHLNFLAPKAEDFEFELKQKLLDEKARVTEINVYRLEIEEKNEAGKLKALLKGGAVDELIITSPTDVVFLKKIFSSENLSENLSDIKVSGIDEMTIQTLRENNLRPRYFKRRT